MLSDNENLSSGVLRNSNKMLNNKDMRGSMNYESMQGSKSVKFKSNTDRLRYQVNSQKDAKIKRCNTFIDTLQSK